MQLLINDYSYDHPERNHDEFLRELEAEVGAVFPSFELREANVPEGADWPVVLAAISGLYFMAKPIRDNYDAWVDLAGRFKALVENLRAKFGSCRVDVNPRCIEYTGLGSSQSLQEGCEDPGQTWSFDRCDTTGAISFCRQNPTSATTLTEVFTYFYFVDPGAWQDFCEMNAGTWEIL